MKHIILLIIAGLLICTALVIIVVRSNNESMLIVDTTNADIVTGSPAPSFNPIKSSPTPTPRLEKGVLRGTLCPYGTTRPMAIMMPSDPEARPLSGISEADMVFEMPVVDVGVTRLMAVFQCNRPKEIGSIRSSRIDFIPLAQGLNAIYAHFGGEHAALDALNKGVINNIDGLKYDGTTYYRKKNKPRPHNAFTNFPNLLSRAKELGYSLGGDLVAYPHGAKFESGGSVQPPAIYGGKFAVAWIYDAKTNLYARTRSGAKEIDLNNGSQVRSANVIYMKTTWIPINRDYIHVKTLGSGNVVVYQNGMSISGTWQKSSAEKKLMFLDTKGNEIEFMPGMTWIEIITQ